jgi:hypothetical protein
MGARAYRVLGYRTLQGAFFGISAIEFRATIGGAAQTGGTAIASSYYTPSVPDLFPANAFDGNDATAWANENNTGLPAWIGMDYGIGANIECGELAIRSYTEANQAPTLFALQRTNDDPALAYAKWYDHSPDFTSTGWTANTWRTFATPTPTNLTLAKLTATVSIGAVDTGLTVAKLVPNVIVGAHDDSLTATKLVATILQGAQPGRLTLAKLMANVLEGAEPDRITMSKIVPHVLLGAQLRPRNGLVQIV